MPSFNSISQALATIKYQTPAFKLIVGEIDEINRNINTDYFKKNNQNVTKIKFEDKIKISNLSYKYPGNDNEKYVFKNLNLEINFGEVVGISGASGAGKSTLVDLLAGLLRPSEGKIIIDSIDINTHPSDWQKQIGYVPQDTYLVDDTIKSNIAFGVPTEKINNNDLNLAIELSQLKKLINSLPEKENSLVGEDGIKLSGGEKQRIGIARALYFRPKVLFLDEPTSSLDSKNEKLILEDIYKLGKNRTILIISHRTNIFKYCKKILNIKDGQVEILYDYKDLI
jgi:ATP-binding cassette subfamily C protein